MTEWGGGFMGLGSGLQSGIQGRRQARYQRRWSAEQNQMNRDWQSNEAVINRDFQERMSSSAYTRATADLDTAGLNKMLAYGNPASQPGGSMGGGSAPGTPADMSGNSARAFSTARESMEFYQQLKNRKADEAATGAQEKKARQETQESVQRQEGVRVTTALNAARLPREQLQEAMWTEVLQELRPWIKELGNSAGDMLNKTKQAAQGELLRGRIRGAITKRSKGTPVGRSGSSGKDKATRRAINKSYNIK